MFVESEKITKLGEYRLKAILDLVLTNARGEFHIVDFKTGNPRYVSDDQLRSYALPILDSRKHKCETVKASYVFLKDASINSFQIIQDEYPQIVENIMDSVRAIEQDREFEPNVTRLCDWCDVRQHCPAYK